MLTTLYLTAEESKHFSALSSKLREGWTVEKAKIAYKDRPELQRIRAEQLKLSDPRLTKDCKDILARDVLIEDQEKFLEELDLTDLNNADVRELLYALGPDILSKMIVVLLRTVESDNDIQEIAGYSTVRHLFFAHA